MKLTGKRKKLVTAAIFLFTLVILTGTKIGPINLFGSLQKIPSWNYNFTEANCLSDHREQNEYFSFTNGKKQNWPLDPTIIAEKTLAWKAHLKTTSPRSYEGRGIVFTWYSIIN
jgi:hypothetical protein